MNYEKTIKIDKYTLLLRSCNFFLFFIFPAFFISGCALRTQIVLMPDLDGKVGIMEISTTAGVQILNRAWQSTENANQDRKPDSPKILSKEEVRQIFREALEAEPLPPTNFTVYFKTDSAALSVNSLPQMTKVFDAIRVRKTADIVVSGHTDATGTTNYNRNLSLKRARVIAYLLVDGGIDRRNIQVTYYGKGNPLIPTPDGMAEPRNRRVEISIR